MTTRKPVRIADRLISSQHAPYIVAELSANHNGSLDRALALVEQAALNGADAVKLQTYKADTITLNSSAECFQIREGLWAGKTLHELYEWAHMPWEWHQPLFDKARDLGLTIFSSPFDFSAVDLLESLDAPAYKIASFEIVDIPLIKYAASTGKPLIISTGMATLAEINEAVEAARAAGCEELIVLHCVSAYPAASSDYHLRTIADIEAQFDVQVGLSDHTIDNTAAIASIALGTCFIEKHFTLNRNDGGPDDSFSLEPADLKSLCDISQKAWEALGKVNYAIKEGEEGNLKFRRSLFACEDIPKGTRLTPNNIRSFRPAAGLAPKHFDELMHYFAGDDIAAGTPLSWEILKREDS